MLELINTIALLAHVNVTDLAGYNRTEKTVAARQLYCYIAVARKLGTLARIGKAINRHHATVIHSCRVAENRIKFEREFRNLYHNIMNNISSEMLSKTRIVKLTADTGKTAYIIEDKQCCLIGIVANGKYYPLHNRLLTPDEAFEVKQWLAQINIEN
jgi:hypothetical protein